MLFQDVEKAKAGRSALSTDAALRLDRRHLVGGVVQALGGKRDELACVC